MRVGDQSIEPAWKNFEVGARVGNWSLAKMPVAATSTNCGRRALGSRVHATGCTQQGARNRRVKPIAVEKAPLHGGRQGRDAECHAVAAVLDVLASWLLECGLSACGLSALLLSALLLRMRRCTIRSRYTVERPHPQVKRDGKPGNRKLRRYFAEFNVLEDLWAGRCGADCEIVDGFRGQRVKPVVAVVCRRGEQCVGDRLSRAG